MIVPTRSKFALRLGPVAVLADPESILVALVLFEALEGEFMRAQWLTGNRVLVFFGFGTDGVDLKHLLSLRFHGDRLRPVRTISGQRLCPGFGDLNVGIDR